MKKISIVVPIYNSEKYLTRCIDSILNQTFASIEVLLVNDGSNDNSPKICDEYAAKDDRIKVIHKPNGGLSTARNAGIDNASSDYICFVDSDDWLDTNILAHCIELFNEHNCDLVDYQCFFTNEYCIVSQEKSSFEIIEGKEILREYLDYGQTGQAPFSMCRKLYRTDLFKDIRCPVGKINEDIATNYKVLQRCLKIIKTSKIGYYYFQEGNSLTRGAFKRKDLDLLDACEDVLELSKNETYKDIKRLAKIKYYRSYFSLLAKMALYGVDDEVISVDKLKKEFIKILRKKYFLLIASKMPVNRKFMMTIICINFNLFTALISIYKRLRKL